MDPHDAKRLKVWRAFSELFLDTEMTDSTYDYIARSVLEAGYAPEEVSVILWGEVFPVLEGNLRSVAGVWAGWPDDWLLKNLKVSSGISAIPSENGIAREIKACWSRVASRLPAEYA